MTDSLQRRFYRQLENAPSCRAITFINKESKFSWHSFEETYKQAVGYAVQLKELGLTQGDVCILVLPSNEHCSKLLLATLLLGAVPLLVAPPVMQGGNSNLLQILRHVIKTTKPKVVVATRAMKDFRNDLEKVHKARYIFEKKELPVSNSNSLPAVMPNDDEVAAMQLTSGTTRFPRICVWKKKNVLAALDGMTQAMKLTKEESCLNWTPLYHDMGLVNNFFLCISKGIPLAMLNPTDFIKQPALWLRGLSDTKATITWSPNFGFAVASKRIADAELEGVRLDGVRAFWNAAERIHLQTFHEFYRRFEKYGLRREALKTNFGCAENVGGATFSNPDPSGKFISERVDALKLQKKGIAQPISNSENGKQTIDVVGVGRPYPGLQVKILSRNGGELPDGLVGEIALKTPSIMEGYMSNKRETRKTIKSNILRTGDLGYSRGGEIFWVGRVKERITMRGKKIDPSEFEGVLLSNSDLRPGCFAIFGVDDPQHGTQRIVLLSEIQNSKSKDHSKISVEIKEQVNLQLGVLISEVILVRKGTLTKTSSGKRRHRYFRELYLNGGFSYLYSSRSNYDRKKT